MRNQIIMFYHANKTIAAWKLLFSSAMIFDLKQITPYPDIFIYFIDIFFAHSVIKYEQRDAMFYMRQRSGHA